MVLNLPRIKNIFGHSRETGEGVASKKRKTIREIFLMPESATTTVSTSWAAAVMSDTGDVSFNFHLPADYNSMVEAKIVVIPDATETIQWDIQIGVAGAGVDANNSDRSKINATLAVTQNLITEIDIMDRLADSVAGVILKAKDYLGIKFSSDTANIQLIGFRYKYS